MRPQARQGHRRAVEGQALPHRSGDQGFRCKVQTPPGQQFEIRTEAYRRIEAALDEAGIAFADNTPRVALYQGAPGERVAAAIPAPDQVLAAK